MFLSFLLSFFLSGVHPLHVSVTEIKFDPKDKELEISARIFIDDLEECIQKELKKTTLDIINPPEGTTTDQLVSAYLATKIGVKVDGKKLELKYLGHEIEGDAMIVYFYAPGVKKLKTIEVFHSTITEVYDDQSNLVHVTLGDKVRSLRLMKNSPSDIIDFTK